jgi:hypothetical protein
MSTSRKMTEAIRLVLISSALVLSGCSHPKDEDEEGADFDQDGAPTTSRQGSSHGGSGYHGGGIFIGHGGGRSGGDVSGGRSGVVSRGGFGGAGQAAGS